MNQQNHTVTIPYDDYMELIKAKEEADKVLEEAKEMIDFPEKFISKVIYKMSAMTNINSGLESALISVEDLRKITLDLGYKMAYSVEPDKKGQFTLKKIDDDLDKH